MTIEQARNILDGADSNQDIHHLLGFTSTLDTNEPVETYLILADAWLEKYHPSAPVHEAAVGS